MLTVLIATYNRAKTLPRQLQAMSELYPPNGGWKLVFINNGSTDKTRDIILEYANKLPIVVIDEQSHGKNRALNMSLGSVEGDLVVLTDSDTVPDKDWLVNIRKTADENPEYDIFGGVIRPVWPDDTPEWIFRLVKLATYSITPENQSDGPTKPELFFGPNVTIRTKVFGKGFRFNEEFGPREGSYRMGGDTEFISRIMAAGHKAWFCTASRVKHIVTPDQLEPKWFFKRAYYGGVFITGMNCGTQNPGARKYSGCLAGLFANYSRKRYMRLHIEPLGILISISRINY